MKIPRGLSAKVFIKKLGKLGYEVTRQTGSHIRVSTLVNGEHRITVPNHNPIKVGTLGGILSEVAEHFGRTKEEIMNELF